MLPVNMLFISFILYISYKNLCHRPGMLWAEVSTSPVDNILQYASPNNSPGRNQLNLVMAWIFKPVLQAKLEKMKKSIKRGKGDSGKGKEYDRPDSAGNRRRTAGVAKRNPNNDPNNRF